MPFLRPVADCKGACACPGADHLPGVSATCAKPALETGKVCAALRDKQYQRPTVGIAARDNHPEAAFHLSAAKQTRRFELGGKTIIHLGTLRQPRDIRRGLTGRCASAERCRFRARILRRLNR